MTSLNPAYTVGNQIAEQVRTHLEHQPGRRPGRWPSGPSIGWRFPRRRVRAQDYPHAFSGGMRQRVMIAMALSCSPKLLIADEPTTALDVTTQAQIIDLLHGLQREEDMAMIFVTHDLGVIADVADDVVVMYAGQIAEQAAAAQSLRPAPPSLHRGPARFDPPAHAQGRTAPRHSRHGAPPDRLPSGCRFAPRCSYAQEAVRGRARWRWPRRPAAPCRPAGTAAGPAPRRALARCVRLDELVLSGPPPSLVSGRPSRARPRTDRLRRARWSSR